MVVCCINELTRSQNAPISCPEYTYFRQNGCRDAIELFLIIEVPITDHFSVVINVTGNQTRGSKEQL